MSVKANEANSIISDYSDSSRTLLKSETKLWIVIKSITIRLRGVLIRSLELNRSLPKDTTLKGLSEIPATSSNRTSTSCHPKGNMYSGEVVRVYVDYNNPRK